MENQTEKILTIEEALSIINGLAQECHVMGANDYEIPALSKLEDQVKAGEISPEESVLAAKKIRYSKQDYH